MKNKLLILIEGIHEDSKMYINGIIKYKNDIDITIKDIQGSKITRELVDIINSHDYVIPVNPFTLGNEEILKSIVPADKDVDNFTGKSVYKHCTVEAIHNIFKENNIDKASEITILGRNLGYLIYNDLIANDYTPIMCHSKTPDISVYTSLSDIVISAVGINNVLTPNMVKEGVLLIEVGVGDIHRDLPAERNIGKLTRSILIKRCKTPK